VSFITDHELINLCSLYTFLSISALLAFRDFLALHSVPLGSLADSSMWNIEVQGKTAVCVALENEILGILGIADVPKPEAYLAVTALRSAGVDVWMVTGDNKTTAEAIADEFGIPKDRVVSGAMPQDKVAKVRELQRAGRSVAMVGDGVNDSPALASANLGIAIGAGTHVAIEAADMVLVRSNLLDVVVALDLAKVVFRRIRINFMFALVYNILAIPFAAGVWFPYTHMQVPPQYAGLSMAMSSISVVASSMAIRFYKKPQILSSGVTGSGSGSGPGPGTGVSDRELREEVGVMGIAKNSGIFSHTKSRLDTLAETWLPVWKGALRSDRISYQALTTMDVCDSKEERHKSLRRDWALQHV
jgi:soluble P-type ATPase